MKTMSKIFSVAAFSMLALVACGKKSSGGGEPAPAPTCTMAQALPPGQYCNNGAVIQALPCVQGQMPQQGYACMNGYMIPMNINMGAAGNLLNGVQFTSAYFMGALNISGSGYIDQTNPYAGSYYGPVTLNGSMMLQVSLCGAPIGTYSVMGSGSMSMGQIQNTVLTISGPASMQLNVISAFVHNPSGTIERNGTGNQIMFDLAAPLTVNGAPCGSITSY